MKIIQKNFNKEVKDFTHVGIIQIPVNINTIIKNNKSIFKKDNNIINNLLKDSISKNIDLLVLPELSVPRIDNEYLLKWSVENKIDLIFGTPGIEYNEIHIVLDGKHYNQHKVALTPEEEKIFSKGKELYLFNNTKHGSLAVINCYELTDIKIRNYITTKIDLLIVISYNKDVKTFHGIMNEFSYNSYSYVIFCNNDEYGGSSFFGPMHHDRCIDKIGPSTNGILLERKLNLKDLELSRFKRKGQGRLKSPPNNVHPIRIRNGEWFSTELQTNDDRIINLEQLYVHPTNYKDIYRRLTSDGVVIITGDPHTGKTFTGLNLLYEFYKIGKDVEWIKEPLGIMDRTLREKFVSQNYCLLIEDPFGKTTPNDDFSILSALINLIEIARNEKGLLIITTRDRFLSFANKKMESRTPIKSFSEGLFIAPPSYTIDNFKKISENYIHHYSPIWGNDEKKKNKIIDLILKTYKVPHNIEFFISTTVSINSSEELERRIKEYSEFEIALCRIYESLQISERHLLISLMLLEPISVKNLCEIWDIKYELFPSEYIRQYLSIRNKIFMEYEKLRSYLNIDSNILISQSSGKEVEQLKSKISNQLKSNHNRFNIFDMNLLYSELNNIVYGKEKKIDLILENGDDIFSESWNVIQYAFDIIEKRINLPNQREVSFLHPSYKEAAIYLSCEQHYLLKEVVLNCFKKNSLGTIQGLVEFRNSEMYKMDGDDLVEIIGSLNLQEKPEGEMFTRLIQLILIEPNFEKIPFMHNLINQIRLQKDLEFSLFKLCKENIHSIKNLLLLQI